MKYQKIKGAFTCDRSKIPLLKKTMLGDKTKYLQS